MKRPEVTSTDLEVLTQARPYLRSAVALLLYLRFAGTGDPLDLAYETADEFLNASQATSHRRTRRKPMLLDDREPETIADLHA